MKKHMRFLFYIFLIVVVRGSFADQNVVPSGSMEPTIHIGDHIYVNKLAYDLHLPYMKTILYRVGEPKRGDIIVFHNPETDMRMVKRLIALPGDHVRIKNGFVWINGQPETGLNLGQNELAEGSSDEILYSDKI